MSNKEVISIYTLNKVAEIAAKYVGEDNIPTKRTLSRWINRQVLSDYVEKEYLGQGGLNVSYPDSIVAEVIAAIELKGKLTLDEIAKARKGESEFTKIYQQKLEEIKQAIK
jgi:uncharacterized protein YbcI